MTLNEILEAAVQKQASDIHLKVGVVPVIRKHGALRPLAEGLQPLELESIAKMASQIMDEEQRTQFVRSREMDISYSVNGLGRFRVNAFYQRGNVRLVIRHIPQKVPTLAELHLPKALEEIASFERGLILVTGMTGSGKSSTLAAMLEHINQNKSKHILTIEDPIEFLLRDRKSLISQRELGSDTRTFAQALRAGLRQDPDIIFVGEMRDRETAEIALQAAETGQLVLSTLHTLDVSETFNRLLALFDSSQQTQVRLQLASTLRAVVGQRLARRKDKKGFVPAVEILVNNTRTREMILDPKRTSLLVKAMEDSKNSFGMQTFDQSLFQLLKAGEIEMDEALRLSTQPDDFKLKAKGISSGDKGKFKASSEELEIERFKVSFDDDGED